MPRPLYPQGKSPQYPLDRRLGGPQSPSGQRGEEKILDKFSWTSTHACSSNFFSLIGTSPVFFTKFFYDTPVERNKTRQTDRRTPAII
jgi:hypothetical protein